MKIEVFEVVMAELLKRGASGLRMQDDYMEAGYVDSLGLLGFVLDLEAALGVRITNEDILLPEFRTPQGLTEILSRK